MRLYATTSPSLNATSIPVQNTCNYRLIIHVQSPSEFDATRIFSLYLYIRRSYNTFCGSNIISGSVWKVYLPSTHFFSLCAFSNRLLGTWKTQKALKSAIAVAHLPSMTPTSKEQRAIVKAVALTFARSACAATTAPVTVWAANQWNTTLLQGHFLGLRKASRI